MGQPQAANDREAHAMIAASTVSVRRPPAPAPLSLTFRPVHLDDLPRVRGAFAEGYKNSPGLSRMPWRFYKQHVVPTLQAVLVHPSTELLGAYSGDELCGWLAFARGRRVDTVHWVSVPFWFPLPSTLCIGCTPAERGPQHHEGGCPLHPSRRQQIRRSGIMRGLFDAAGLKERLAYTHRGARHEHRDSDGMTMDERLMPWIRSRGQWAVYVKWEEWAR